MGALGGYTVQAILSQYFNRVKFLSFVFFRIHVLQHVMLELCFLNIIIENLQGAVEKGMDFFFFFFFFYKIFYVSSGK